MDEEMNPDIHDIVLSSGDFLKILNSSAFVDKSLAIKEIVRGDGENSYLITTPRRFGKSAVVSMLKLFLELEVDDAGNQITKSTINQPVRDTGNYQIFTSPIPKVPNRKLKISYDIDTMDRHFGKYPIVFVNFSCGHVNSFEDVVASCKEIIHESYLKHEYLYKSPNSKLDGPEKRICRKWCSDEDYLKFTQRQVISGLKTLSRYLRKYFKRPCFVIVDEYDSVCSSSMFKLGEDDLSNTITFFLSIMDRLLKGNEENVRSGFITGISHMCTTGLSQINNVISFKFLQNDDFWNHYGLTIEEALDLKMRFSLGDEEFNRVLDYYNGYQRCGEKIFSIWSFNHYLRFRKLENYWKDSGVAINLLESLKIPLIKLQVLGMLSQGPSSIVITDVGKLQVADILRLKSMQENPNLQMTDSSLYCMFLMEQGYFSIVEEIVETGKTKKLRINIPNQEIKCDFREKMKNYFIKTYGLNADQIEECAVHWNSLDFTDGNSIFEKLKEIRRLLNLIFNKIEFEQQNEACFHHVMFVIFLETKFKCKSETLCAKYINPGILDLLLQYEDNIVIIELKYNLSCQNAMECIINRNYCDVMRTPEYHANHFVLLGVNMAEDKVITMCCSIDRIGSYETIE